MGSEMHEMLRVMCEILEELKAIRAILEEKGEEPVVAKTGSSVLGKETERQFVLIAGESVLSRTSA